MYERVYIFIAYILLITTSSLSVYLSVRSYKRNVLIYNISMMNTITSHTLHIHTFGQHYYAKLFNAYICRTNRKSSVWRRVGCARVLTLAEHSKLNMKII